MQRDDHDRLKLRYRALKLFVLSKASHLKNLSNEYWQKIFLSPDRNREERQAHQKLVVKLKQKIVDCPNKRHYIKDGHIIRTAHLVLSESAGEVKEVS